ncbi:MAG: 8-amino-7-oxononanoate synthase [Ekhidna sp.]|nr:8-amino-7-oxononanoate synthase [Ekhidna sp.]
MNSYQKALEERKKQHLLRTLPLPPEGFDFYSNDYLGFAQSKSLQSEIEKANTSIKKNGSTGSRLLSGNSSFALEVEQQIADFHQTEAATVYPSGYTANIGLISCLATKETTLVCDELIHASLIDGARLGVSRKVRFRHNSIESLEEKLQSIAGQKLVIVESVYSMDGDICPLEQVAELCTAYNAMLIVDEAHAMGVYGENGEGLVQELNLHNRVLARIVTYGKGPGIHGAAVVGPLWLKEYQVNFSRSLIFSTAPNDHQFASISAMYTYLPFASADRNKLHKIVAYFIQKRKDSKFQWVSSPSQIQSLIVPGNEQVIKLSTALRQGGINALPIRKPSVAEGSERIRFCIHAYNTNEEIDLLFRTLENYLID